MDVGHGDLSGARFLVKGDRSQERPVRVCVPDLCVDEVVVGIGVAEVGACDHPADQERLARERVADTEGGHDDDAADPARGHRGGRVGDGVGHQPRRADGLGPGRIGTASAVERDDHGVRAVDRAVHVAPVHRSALDCGQSSPSGQLGGISDEGRESVALAQGVVDDVAAGAPGATEKEEVGHKSAPRRSGSGRPRLRTARLMLTHVLPPLRSGSLDTSDCLRASRPAR